MSSATMIAMLAGAAISAVGAVQQGKAASDAANFNAQVANNNAIASRASAAESAKRQGRLGRKHMATVRLNDLSGDVIADEALEVEKDTRRSARGRVGGVGLLYFSFPLSREG